MARMLRCCRTTFPPIRPTSSRHDWQVSKCSSSIERVDRGILCMSDKVQISGRVIAAARALASINQTDFAAAAGLSIEAVRLIEEKGSAWVQSEDQKSTRLNSSH